ncbi:MAG: OsmC family peroxiredoxin [Candidatus Hydrogenedens sp.]|nr:OsmC family peroxiredoxin [Candidatus Hydrogenedens sp.]
MSEHRVGVDWKLGDGDFTYETYPREHTWRFAEGPEIAASAAPEFLGKPECVDPEQAFVAAVSSCHMLTFLAIAARKRMRVEAYADDAVGYLEKNEEGRLAVTRVELRPRITFGGEGAPDAETLEKLHESSHRNCFIANSVRCEIVVMPT